jgi:hypothetical protein
MTIRNCPCKARRHYESQVGPRCKGSRLVRAWVLLSSADGQPPVQPGQPVEPVVRLICAVRGGNGGAHLRPPGHHTHHVTAQVPEPVLVSRTRGQGCQGGGLYPSFLLPFPFLSPPYIPATFFAPAGHDPSPGPDSPSTCLCYPRPLCLSTGLGCAWLFCLCSGHGTLREESAPLTQASAPVTSAHLPQLPSCLWCVPEEQAKQGAQEVVQRTGANELLRAALPLLLNTAFHTSTGKSPLPLDQPSQTWSFDKERSRETTKRTEHI